MTLRVLLIEDRVDQADEITRVLKPKYEVSHVRTLYKALRMLKREPHVAALIDVDLQETLNGIDCAEDIRVRYPAIRIIIYSAYEYTREREQRVVELGGLFLPKPITEADLFAALDGAGNASNSQ
jgi:DNA-binding NtrC family response regulator